MERGRKRDELDRKIDGFGDDLPKHLFGHVRRGKWPDHAKTNFREGQAAKFLELFGSVARDLHGQVQAAIGREAAEGRSSQGGERGFAGGAAVSHRPFVRARLIPEESCSLILSKNRSPVDAVASSDSSDNSRKPAIGTVQCASVS